MIVPDASVVVEVLKRSASGVALSKRFATEELIAPDLIDVEVASALRRSWLRGDMTDEDVRSTMDILLGLRIRRVPDRVLVRASTAWWNNVTAYDAMYLAAAVLFDATVVTVDGPLSRAPITDVVIENVRVGPPT